ncbi:MAG: hypothetical protein CAF41_006010 [Nitrospira sp. CG24A]|nr:MAG: hypothetical protein CAF41_006010 [Nitrospira sp. CG24A]
MTILRWPIGIGLSVIGFTVLMGQALPVQAQSSPVQAKTFAGKFAMLDGDIPYWVDQHYIDRALTRLKAAGFNVYMPTVWQGRGTAWPSKYAPWDIALKNRPKTNFDPLRYAIKKAHELGMEVHPWFTLTLRQGDLFPEYAPPGTPSNAFDVHNPAFRQWMTNLISEVVEHYDVDGINLDYVRAVGLCSSEFCTSQYANQYGRSLSADSTLFRLTFGKAAHLAEFQEQAVTSMVRSIVEAVRQSKPSLLISVDAIPGQAGPEQGAASVKWVNEGLVDVILRMDYFPKVNVSVTDSVRGALHNPDALTLLICNMATEEELKTPTQPRFPRSGAWVSSTVSMIQSRWPKTGLAVYFYKYFTDEQAAALKGEPFHGRFDPPQAPKNLSVR